MTLKVRYKGRFNEYLTTLINSDHHHIQMVCRYVHGQNARKTSRSCFSPLLCTFANSSYSFDHYECTGSFLGTIHKKLMRQNFPFLLSRSDIRGQRSNWPFLADFKLKMAFDCLITSDYHHIKMVGRFRQDLS